MDSDLDLFAGIWIDLGRYIYIDRYRHIFQNDVYLFKVDKNRYEVGRFCNPPKKSKYHYFWVGFIT